MEIRANDNICIFTPKNSVLDEKECTKLFKHISSESRAVAIDLAHVRDCTFDFIENIKAACSKKKIGIFNIPSDIFVIFNIMKIDRSANLFVSESDFIEDTRTLLKRDFRVI